jgi:hypothetical protein
MYLLQLCKELIKTLSKVKRKTGMQLYYSDYLLNTAYQKYPLIGPPVNLVYEIINN